MALLKKINETVSLIDTEALGLPRVVACYLVRGKESALLDMGYRSSAESVIRDLVSLGVGSDEVDYLLPTHVHLDHSGSCGTIARRFPRASVLAHPVGVPHLSDPTRLVEGAGELFGEALMRRYGLPDPIENKKGAGSC
jgi:glyoxylase-like metal-dependent hydrolase (beta-lactamase superfamily II)